MLSGTFLNTRFTGKIPLILGWLGAFVLQAALRSQLQGTSLTAALLPMTGMAFLLFTFYMVTDPGTTPSSSPGQFAFGSAVAAVYGLLMLWHVVFGLFFALADRLLRAGIGIVRVVAVAAIDAGSRALAGDVTPPARVPQLLEAAKR